MKYRKSKVKIERWEDLHDDVKPLIAEECARNLISWKQAEIITEKLNRLEQLEKTKTES
ncbi:MAG: hypothetical protein ACOCUT_04465 [bacterium]